LKDGVKQRIEDFIQQQDHKVIVEEDFSLSIKTRIGFNSNVVSEWTKHLEEVAPDWISIHGRTLKQGYAGESNWDAITEAVEITAIPILGNGNIQSGNDAVEMIKQTGVAGVLIGRGTFGNPWIFRQGSRIKKLSTSIEDYEPTLEEILTVMREHAQLHLDFKGKKAFLQLRKHFAWYVKGFLGASNFRAKLVRVSNMSELDVVISEIQDAMTNAEIESANMR